MKLFKIHFLIKANSKGSFLIDVTSVLKKHFLLLVILIRNNDLQMITQNFLKISYLDIKTCLLLN